MSLAPQSFLEVAYSIPPVVASAWGVVKTIKSIQAPKSNGQESVREREARAELERTRWQNVLTAIEGVGTALKEEAARLGEVRQTQVGEVIPLLTGIHEEVVGRREEHAKLMRDLMESARLPDRRQRPR